MKYITIPTLGKYQHYKKRRPPWMKLHSELLQDYEFSLLSDAEKYQLIGIWLLATQLDNKLPDDEKWLCGKIQAKSINLTKFKRLGMVVQHASNTLAECKQSAVVETEAEAYKEEAEKSTDTCAANASLFDAFWKEYPRKRDKKKAKEAWLRKKLNDKAEMVTQDVIKRIHSDSQWLKGYIPLPTTYINGERWQDELVIRQQMVSDTTIQNIINTEGWEDE